MLTAETNTVGMCAMQSVGDAETLIATTAVDLANSTVVIGEDTDLLVLFIHFVNRYRLMLFSCQTKILTVNPKYGEYGLHVNSWGNVYVMGY